MLRPNQKKNERSSDRQPSHPDATIPQQAGSDAHLTPMPSSSVTPQHEKAPLPPLLPRPQHIASNLRDEDVNAIHKSMRKEQAFSTIGKRPIVVIQSNAK